MSTLIWQWRRPDRLDMTDSLAVKAATKNKGTDLLKGYRERVCSLADPMYRSHILNIWMWVQVKFASLYRFVSLPVIICYWVQVFLLLIYSLGCSKQYLLHQIVEPAFRKCWYRWHKSCTFWDFLNAIYKVSEFGEILEESRKDNVIIEFQKWSVIFLSIWRKAVTYLWIKMGIITLKICSFSMWTVAGTQHREMRYMKLLLEA